MACHDDPPLHSPFARKARLNPNPTFFQKGAAREPSNRRQWGSALRANPQATAGGVTDGRACRQPVGSRATVSGLACLANRLVNVSYCRIRVKTTIAKASYGQERIVRRIDGALKHLGASTHRGNCHCRALDPSVQADRAQPLSQSRDVTRVDRCSALSGLTLKLKSACDPYDEIQVS